MKVFISYPPLESEKGVATLGQNRQFQWFSKPSFIYPMVPASAATLLSSQGFNVIWNDAIAEQWTYPQWLANFEDEKPDLIAMETKTPVVKRHWRIIDDIKAHSPETIVVLMGDHVTALPEESMRESAADFILTGGDYDFLLLNLCETLQGRADLEPGFWFRENGSVKNTGQFVLNLDLDSLPFVDRKLTRWYLYGEHLLKKPCSYTMVGRDCWYHKCRFCSWPTLFPTFRTRSPESLLDEIGQLLDQFYLREIFDDTGTFPVGEWLRKFCLGMIERDYARQLQFSCNMRVGTLKIEDYQLMKKAGFRTLKFGLESANQKTLDRLNKGTRVEHIAEACRLAKQVGLEPHLTSMVGYPWETLEDAQNTLNLAYRLFDEGSADTIQATVVIPYPGAPLFAEVEENDWLIFGRAWERYDMTEPVLRTEVDSHMLMDLVGGLYKSFISPRFIMRKILSIRSLYDVQYYATSGWVAIKHVLDFGRNKRWGTGDE